MRLVAPMLAALLVSCGSDDAAPACDPAVERGGRISSRGAGTFVCVGGSLELAFDVWECASTRDYTAEAQWSSSNAAIATVEQGVVRGVAAGRVNIVATIDTRTDAIELSVDACADAGATD